MLFLSSACEYVVLVCVFGREFVVVCVCVVCCVCGVCGVCVCVCGVCVCVYVWYFV